MEAVMALLALRCLPQLSGEASLRAQPQRGREFYTADAAGVPCPGLWLDDPQLDNSWREGKRERLRQSLPRALQRAFQQRFADRRRREQQRVWQGEERLALWQRPLRQPQDAALPSPPSSGIAPRARWQLRRDDGRLAYLLPRESRFRGAFPPWSRSRHGSAQSAESAASDRGITVSGAGTTFTPGALARGLRARRGGLECASPASVLASPGVMDGVSVAVSASAVIAVLYP